MTRLQLLVEAYERACDRRNWDQCRALRTLIDREVLGPERKTTPFDHGLTRKGLDADKGRG